MCIFPKELTKMQKKTSWKKFFWGLGDLGPAPCTKPTFNNLPQRVGQQKGRQITMKPCRKPQTWRLQTLMTSSKWARSFSHMSSTFVWSSTLNSASLSANFFRSCSIRSRVSDHVQGLSSRPLQGCWSSKPPAGNQVVFLSNPNGRGGSQGRLVLSGNPIYLLKSFPFLQLPPPPNGAPS